MLVIVYNDSTVSTDMITKIVDVCELNSMMIVFYSIQDLIYKFHFIVVCHCVRCRPLYDQCHCICSSLDIGSSINVDMEIEDERNKAMTDSTITLVASLTVNIHMLEAQIHRDFSITID